MSDLIRTQYLDDIRIIRGKIIEQAIYIERFIDYYIANYFCGDKRKSFELIDIIISTNKITFDSKLEVFKTITEKYNNQFLINNPQLINRIRKIIQVRNVFAHHQAYLGDEALEKYEYQDVYTFIKFKNDTVVLEYSKIDIDNIYIECTEISTNLRLLNNL
jgi:hypothetical protein